MIVHLFMKKYLGIIPLGILVIAQLYSLYITQASNTVLGNKQYLGLLFVAICILLLFFNKTTISIYFTGIVLIIGSLNWIAFLPFIESYSLGLRLNNKKGVELKLQPFSLIVLLIYLFINYKILIQVARKKT